MARSRLLPAAFLAATLCLVAASCTTTGKGSDDRELSFSEVQAVQPGLTATQLVDAYGPPVRASRRPDGTYETMDYIAFDAKGGRNHLVLDLDARERVVRKTFTGAILRPR